MDAFKNFVADLRPVTITATSNNSDASSRSPISPGMAGSPGGSHFDPPQQLPHQQGGWRTRLLKIRGFADIGTPESDKLLAADCKKHGEAIYNLWSDEIRGNCWLEEPN